MTRIPSLLAAVAALALSLPASAGEVKERTTYFAVRGTTLEELDRELARKGPTAGTEGVRHPGATQVSFGGRVTYGPSGAGCSVAKTDFTLKLVKTLPRWKPPKAASAGTVIVWKTLAEDIARHEEDHARIARTYLKLMESAVRNLPSSPDCDAMEQAVNRVTRRYLADHEAAQREFDTIEGREVNGRLRRLLKKNVEAAEAEG